LKAFVRRYFVTLCRTIWDPTS